MTTHQLERASPPDDGGHMGSYTTPAQLLLTAPEDTRSSETIGTEPLLRDNATNRVLLVFWSIVFALELALALVARWL